MADAYGLGPYTERYGGSSPSVRRFLRSKNLEQVKGEQEIVEQKENYLR